MKKFISLFLAALMVMSFGLSSFAATEFVKSIEAKDAPEIVTPEGYGDDIAALILDKTDAVKDTVPRDELIITPFDPKGTDDIQKELKSAYDSIRANKISGVLSDADKKEIENAGVKVSNLVVTDLFDVYYTKQDTLSEDNKLNVTFSTDLKLKTTDKLFVMVEVDGVWIKVPAKDVKITPNGNINVSFTKLCPVAFMIESEPDNTSSAIPVWFWIALASVSLLAIVLISFFGLRNKKESENF